LHLSSSLYEVFRRSFHLSGPPCLLCICSKSLFTENACHYGLSGRLEQMNRWNRYFRACLHPSYHLVRGTWLALSRPEVSASPPIAEFQQCWAAPPQSAHHPAQAPLLRGRRLTGGKAELHRKKLLGRHQLLAFAINFSALHIREHRLPGVIL